jgi:hypothetical protein
VGREPKGLAEGEQEEWEVTSQTSLESLAAVPDAALLANRRRRCLRRSGESDGVELNHGFGMVSGGSRGPV